jgi:putative transposase
MRKTTGQSGRNSASEPYRTKLEKHGLRGSMGRRGNPYDNAKAENFMKTLKHEEVHLNGYETFQDVIARLPRFLEEVYNARRKGCLTQTASCPSSGGQSN